MAITILALLVAAGVLGCGSDEARDRSDSSAGPSEREDPPAPAAAANSSLPPVDPADKPLPALRSPRLRVEKAARRLTVFDGDVVAKTYRAAVGRGEGDKVREGDLCTPEGQFYVCLKNPQSEYYLSLGLSYPNLEDAERGLRDGLIDRRQYERIAGAIGRKATPPWKTPLGGEIMIHGRGAQTNWTAGCVALADGAIAELYAALPVGTPVEIVP